MRNEIKRNLEKLTKLEAIADKAEEEYTNDYMNEEKENAFDEAYKKEFDMYISVSREIAILAGISENTARRMVKTKRAEIISILS